MYIKAIDNTHFTAELPKNINVVTSGSITKVYKDYKDGKFFKRISSKTDENELLKEVINYFTGIKSEICNSKDEFYRKDLDNKKGGLYIGEFLFTKNPDGKITSVSFYYPNEKLELHIDDISNKETKKRLRAAFKKYNEYINRFHKK